MRSLAQGHLDTLGRVGDRTSNHYLPVTSQPAVPPELLSPQNLPTLKHHRETVKSQTVTLAGH